MQNLSGATAASLWKNIPARQRAIATQFLGSQQQGMPFPIRALQVDDGSKFAAEFEQAGHTTILLDSPGPVFIMEASK